MRNYILLILAILAGILAFFISKQQLERRYAEIRQMTETVEVIAVRRAYVAGEKLERADLGGIEILRSQVTEDHVLRRQEWEAVIGQALLVPLALREPVRWSFLDLGEMVMGSANPLARRIPDGERALAIPVDTVSSVASMVRPNDRVDIIGTFRFPPEQGSTGSQIDLVTYTIMEDVTILAVGQQLAGQAGVASRGYSTVTISVTPEEAELLVFAQQKGSLLLTLRPPLDVRTIKEHQSINFDYFRENLNRLNDERRERRKPAAGRP